MVIEHPGRGGGADPANPRVPVLRVPNQRQVVRNQPGLDPELLLDRLRIPNLPGSAVHLHHPAGSNALRQVLVVGPDADLLHPPGRRASPPPPPRPRPPASPPRPARRPPPALPSARPPRPSRRAPPPAPGTAPRARARFPRRPCTRASARSGPISSQIDRSQL